MDRHTSPAPDVAIVGGGVIGCAIAYQLVSAGATVTVCERGQVGGQASGAAAGMLAPLAECRAPSPFLDLASASLQRFPALAERLRAETGLDIELVRSGLLRVAVSDDEAEELRRALAWKQAAGYSVEWLDAAGARECEPSLGPNVVGAVWSPAEQHVASPRLVAALAQAAGRAGAQFRLGTPVGEFLRQGDRIAGVVTADGSLPAGHVVVATGAWTGLLGQRLDLNLPVAPIRGQILALETLPQPLHHIVYAKAAYFVPKPDGSVVVGATEDAAGFDARVTVQGLSRLLNAVAPLLPGLAGAAFGRAWAGLRPHAPDHWPLLGPAPGLRNLTVASGHYRNGILLSPITGELIADLVLTGRAEPLLSAFDPGRFGR